MADPIVFRCVGTRIQEVTDEGMGLLSTVDLEELVIRAPQHVFFGWERSFRIPKWLPKWEIQKTLKFMTI